MALFQVTPTAGDMLFSSGWRCCQSGGNLSPILMQLGPQRLVATESERKGSSVEQFLRRCDRKAAAEFPVDSKLASSVEIGAVEVDGHPQGQRPSAPRKQAGQMTAPRQTASRNQITPCRAGAVHR